MATRRCQIPAPLPGAGLPTALLAAMIARVPSFSGSASAFREDFWRGR